jgi:arylsulfatase A-like enzyme
MVVLAFALHLCGGSSAAQPNVLVLLSDDQRCDSIGAWGNPAAKTPNLDALTRRGTAFRRAYCMGAMQGAVCVPSRAMLLSGRSLFRIDERLRDTPTWPEAFARAGYETFMTGKWHNGPSVARVFPSGKAIFMGGMVDPRRAPVVDVAGGMLGPKRLVERHCVAEFARQAADFIRARPAGKPWLCYAAFNAPHDPCIVPDDFPLRFDPAALPLPANFLPEHPFDNGELRVRDELLAPHPRTEAALRRELADYYRAVSYLDAQIGVVLAALRESGQENDTLVLFASDHGLAKGSHGLLGKQNLYEHSMRTPLVLAGPGVPVGVESQALCYLFDAFPTLGQLASVPAPAGNEGQSLVRPLQNHESAGRPYIFTAYREFQRAVCDRQWKYLEYTVAGRRRIQLFDLERDADERIDLSGDPRHADRLGRMSQLLGVAAREFGAR